jgi:ribosomal protein S18 acetylase RimI-like enzyme
MIEYTIRSITKQDIPFLWETLYESIFTPEGQEPPSRNIIKHPSISKYVKDWGRTGDFGLIAMNNSGESIGSITIRYFKKDNKGYGYVNDETPELGLAVLSKYRGQGIGTALIKSLLEQGKTMGIKAISLSVDPNNPAMNLYKRFGFNEVRIEGTSVIMLLDL